MKTTETYTQAKARLLAQFAELSFFAEEGTVYLPGGFRLHFGQTALALGVFDVQFDIRGQTLNALMSHVNALLWVHRNNPYGSLDPLQC